MRRQHTVEDQEPRPLEVSREEVLAHLSAQPHPATIRQIAHAMELKHRGRRYLPRIIQQLKKAGDIEEIHGGRYRLTGSKQSSRPAKERPSPVQQEERAASGSPRRSADPNLIAGRMVTHRDGYGFVVPDKPIPGVEGDLFIGRDGIGDAMHGDKVLARIARRRNDGRAEGRIVQVVEREHPTLVGLFRYGAHSNQVLPYDTRIHHEVLIPPGDELSPDLRQKLRDASGADPSTNRRVRLAELDGAVVNVEITRYPKGGLAPTGRVLEILGRPGEIGVDVEIIIRKHHLPHEFPAEAVAEAKAAPQTVTEADLDGRRDFRNLPIVTIDGETARDFDDAVHVAPLPNGHYELQVHIADVAHYVRRASPLDQEARLRGNSVYFPNRAIPMLPEELSNGICSLNPKVDRLVMSVVMEMDASGNMVRSDFTPGVIRSVERMTYTNVHKVLEGDPEMTQRYAASGRRVPPHEGAGAPAEQAARRTRLHRLRSSRADHRVRRSKAACRASSAACATLRTASSRSSCSPRTKLSRNISKSAASPRCTASTKSPTPKRFSNLKNWRTPSAIPLVWTISPSVASP